MSSGIVASVQCPACGQAFLCQQQNAAGMVSCPHCAHQALRGSFITHGHAGAVGTERRRVVPAAHHPAEEAAPPAAAAYPPEVMAWMSQQAALQAAPPILLAQAAAPVKTAMHTTMHWQTRPDLDSTEPGASPAPDPGGEFVPQHLQRSPWPWLAALVIIVALLGGGVWVWMENQKGQQAAAARPSAPAGAFPLIEAPKKVPTTLPEIAEEKLRTHPPDVSAISADARRLVDEFFNQATTPEQRAACVSGGAAHSAQIESLLGPQNPAAPKLAVLAPVRGIAVRIPDIHFEVLFRVSTSANKDGALLRLIDDPDGKRRIDWPLFYESHQKLVRVALREKPQEPRWTMALLLPRHAFQIPLAERERHLTYQMYISADGQDSLTCCVRKDSQLGRYMLRSTTWNQAYMARVLVRRASFDTTGDIVEMIDCEGAVVDSTMPSNAVPTPEPEVIVRPAVPVPEEPPQAPAPPKS